MIVGLCLVLALLTLEIDIPALIRDGEVDTTQSNPSITPHLELQIQKEYGCIPSGKT